MSYFCKHIILQKHYYYAGQWGSHNTRNKVTEDDVDSPKTSITAELRVDANSRSWPFMIDRTIDIETVLFRKPGCTGGSSMHCGTPRHSLPTY
jgi:hypothetical protein